MRRKIAIGTLGLYGFAGGSDGQLGAGRPLPQGARPWARPASNWWRRPAPMGWRPASNSSGGGRGQFGRPGERRDGLATRRPARIWRRRSALCAWRKIPACANISVSRTSRWRACTRSAWTRRKLPCRLARDMELRHIELRELLRADNPDHDAIMQKLDEVNALRGKMEKQRVETMLSARSVLTPEQLKKIKTFMENRGSGGGPERGHMMERRGGPGRPSRPSWRRSRQGLPRNRKHLRLSRTVASKCRRWIGAPFHRRFHACL